MRASLYFVQFVNEILEFSIFFFILEHEKMIEKKRNRLNQLDVEEFGRVGSRYKEKTILTLDDLM